ncbi:DUF3558 family protein [Nocardia sp. NPDC057455]|uniref:DUF3558 family protein n=1 Tax=Nocardia sp. NPDC057455 TaxID=3346138 RepID=UPI003672B9B4
MTTPARKGVGLSRFARTHLAVIAPAAAVLAITGCSGSDHDAAHTPTSATTTANASASTTPAAPSVSPISGLDVCTLVTPDEVFNAVGKQGLAPQRTIDEKHGQVVAESCNWGSETEGLITVSWMREPIPAWGENKQSRAFTDIVGRRVTLNTWEGKACTAFAESANGNIGINIVPSDASLTAQPSGPGNDICDRNRPAIVAAFERAQRA